jgi:CheY-like chemotaxis protein
MNGGDRPLGSFHGFGRERRAELGEVCGCGEELVYRLRRHSMQIAVLDDDSHVVASARRALPEPAIVPKKTTPKRHSIQIVMHRKGDIPAACRRYRVRGSSDRSVASASSKQAANAKITQAPSDVRNWCTHALRDDGYAGWAATLWEIARSGNTRGAPIARHFGSLAARREVRDPMQWTCQRSSRYFGHGAAFWHMASKDIAPGGVNVVAHGTHRSDAADARAMTLRTDDGECVRSVLVIEDDPALLSSVAEVIREVGYDVRTACNGHQALDEVFRREPDLILIDLMLPLMDGWRFLEHYRSRCRQCRAALVLVSAFPNLAAEAARLGVQGYLRKPFGLDAVVRITHECCPRSLAPD